MSAPPPPPPPPPGLTSVTATGSPGRVLCLLACHAHEVSGNGGSALIALPLINTQSKPGKANGPVLLISYCINTILDILLSYIWLWNRHQCVFRSSIFHNSTAISTFCKKKIIDNAECVLSRNRFRNFSGTRLSPCNQPTGYRRSGQWGVEQGQEAWQRVVGLSPLAAWARLSYSQLRPREYFSLKF